MIQRVYEQCKKAPELDAVIVATDDERVRDAVRAFGGDAVMTRPEHPSGTDRLAEVAANLDVDLIVNIQGDQPFFNPFMIAEVTAPLIDDASAGIATLMYPIHEEADFDEPAVVKVVVDRAGFALYFSRSRIPYPREPIAHPVYEHVGTYAYRRETLLELAALPPTLLEQVEALEQLRWLEHGLRIRVVESQVEDRAYSGFSVDTPDDLARAERMIRERGLA